MITDFRKAQSNKDKNVEMLLQILEKSIFDFKKATQFEDKLSPEKQKQIIQHLSIGSKPPAATLYKPEVANNFVTITSSNVTPHLHQFSSNPASAYIKEEQQCDVQDDDSSES